MELLLQDANTPLAPAELLEALSMLRAVMKDTDTLVARQLEETRMLVAAQREQMEEFLNHLEQRMPRD